MRTLNAAEIAVINELITHCERMVNARGHHDGQSGTCETGPFTMAIRRSEQGCALQVWRHGDSVMEVSWSWRNDDPGHAYVKPGAWHKELLRLPAAHA